MKKKEVRKGASRSGKLLLKTRCVDSPKTAAVKPTALQVNVVVLAQSLSQSASGRQSVSETTRLSPRLPLSDATRPQQFLIPPLDVTFVRATSVGLDPLLPPPPPSLILLLIPPHEGRLFRQPGPFLRDIRACLDLPRKKYI